MLPNLDIPLRDWFWILAIFSSLAFVILGALYFPRELIPEIPPFSANVYLLLAIFLCALIFFGMRFIYRLFLGGSG